MNNNLSANNAMSRRAVKSVLVAVRWSSVPQKEEHLKSLAVASLLIAVCALQASEARDGLPGETRASDSVCGPRCVHEVLRRYGVQCELIELIREIQWPDVSSGASFQQLSDALVARGFKTELVAFGDVTARKESFPAIVHIEDVADHRLSHFVVVQSVDGSVSFWDGPNGTTWNRDVAPSAIALMTSPLSAEHQSTCVVEEIWTYCNAAVLFGLIRETRT